jgi:hypothetical protein
MSEPLSPEIHSDHEKEPIEEQDPIITELLQSLTNNGVSLVSKHQTQNLTLFVMDIKRCK